MDYDMKTHTIKTPTAELMVVELPENIESDYSLIYRTAPEETYLSFRKNAEFKPPRKSEKLADGNWKCLGKPDEISEEDAMELVEKIEYDFGTCYRHYTDKTVFARTAKESLLSLLESKIFWENPWGVNGSHLDSYKQLWKEAQEMTFDSNRSLIFKKSDI